MIHKIKVDGTPCDIYEYKIYGAHGGRFIFIGSHELGDGRVIIGRDGIAAVCSFHETLSDSLKQACMLWIKNEFSFAGLTLMSFLKEVGAVDESGEMV